MPSFDARHCGMSMPPTVSSAAQWPVSPHMRRSCRGRGHLPTRARRAGWNLGRQRSPDADYESPSELGKENRSHRGLARAVLCSCCRRGIGSEGPRWPVPGAPCVVRAHNRRQPAGHVRQSPPSSPVCRLHALAALCPPWPCASSWWLRACGEGETLTVVAP